VEGNDSGENGQRLTPGSAPASAAAPQPSGGAGSIGPASPVPVLGRLAGVFAQGTGFGRARPRKIFNGGDPTGLVTKVSWQSWGGAQDICSGTYAPNP